MATVDDTVQDGVEAVPDIYQCTVKTPHMGRQYITFDDSDVDIETLLELCGETELIENAEQYGMLVKMPDPHHPQNVQYFVPSEDNIDLAENQVQYVEIVQVWDDETVERERADAERRQAEADAADAAAAERQSAIDEQVALSQEQQAASDAKAAEENKAAQGDTGNGNGNGDDK